MFIGIPSIEFKSKHPDDWLNFFFFKSSPPDDCQVKVPSDGSQVCRGNRTGEVLSWDPMVGSFLMGQLVVPFGGVFLGSFGAILWWAPYMEQLHAACLLLLACLLILIILELTGWACCWASYKLQSVSVLAHHCYAGLAGLDNHGADLSWSSTSLISVLV